MTTAERDLGALDDPSRDRPKSMDAIDKHAQQAQKLNARAVNDQAAKVGGAATKANDLGDDLKLFRDDVLREWEGKDADAVADHLEALGKASYKVSDKAEAAKNILQRVSEILDEVKKKVAQLAQEANDKDADNRALIGAARQRKNNAKDDNEIAAAATDIERLRQLNEKDSNGKKEEIERALDAAEKQIDDLLKPLGLEIEGGFLELIPAESGQTTASSVHAKPVDSRVGPAPVYGGGDGGGGGGGGVAGVQGDGRPAKPIDARGDNPAKIAEQFLGRNAGDLKRSGELPAMQSWVPNNVNCANFVSGCLEAAGLIDKNQASASVAGLTANLEADGWKSVPLSQAKPGDVVISNGGGHVVLYAGDGQFIGSNNINPDGSQKISMGGGGGLVKVLTPPT
ncbi:NlpC/P60 family protein [Amycolatopsis regifaucium]|uniref:Peptidoglycan-binding protein n=1 Tax=Amycolatopsis regifaucium TaxID=546365 RepID=A0A154M744_9PSEU|nr:NlpC/P60 family protein [Amycolatopsis regifaucium]KZB80177.1 peptidoglycan-binding protein [Amycolatopsis regifaucium]OKA09452.1 peptidoglycan-binding protein [Amycolatopsis regifaucium]SFH61877.1 NlpC/P60 family protein [Amycolatopsis regifaucium]